MAEIIVAKSAGFCFGVNRAINMAYDEINKNKNIYTYGPLIHNKEVIADLEKKGIHVIKDLEEVEQGTVMIRSHGVGEKVYDAIKQKRLQMVDGTCPFVKRIHDIVKQAYEQKRQIIIVGDGKHPEVQGINGWCENSAILLAEAEKTEHTQF